MFRNTVVFAGCSAADVGVLVRDFMRTVDVNHDGAISREEFQRAALDPMELNTSFSIMESNISLTAMIIACKFRRVKSNDDHNHATWDLKPE